VYLLLGFDMNANPIEILYNEFGDNGVNVFHVMACQSRFLELLIKELDHYVAEYLRKQSITFNKSLVQVISVCPQSRLLCGQILYFLA
jgi:hypothetical protein